MKESKIEPLKVTYDCIPCAISSLITLFNKGIVSETKQAESMRSLLRYLSKVNYNQKPPALGREMHELIRKVINDSDPYHEIKKSFNQLMLAFYPEFKKQVTKSSDPFQMALRFAIAGNVIDFGPNHKIDFQDTIERANSVKLGIDHSLQLKESIHNARTILYIGDNAGEIVMDKLFLETIHHPHVFYGVRGEPIINDATIEDAQQVGIDEIASVISNGDNSPGTLLDRVSSEYKDIFEKADLIISKGQGNYEGLIGTQKNIFFMLMAKCDHVANHLGVRKGDFLVVKG